MLGSIISSTDPVAIVALLKSLGASYKFSSLIEGESLFNDGSAMVFFTIFSALTKGRSNSLLEVIYSFGRLSVGGPLFGFVIGFLISKWLRRIVNDEILIINITFVMCYLLFFFSETYFNVSGILALVTLGLFMSSMGKTRIHHEAEHSLHVVWSFAQYACETIIFLLTGIIVGQNILRNENSTIDYYDWLKLFLMYIGMTISRGVMVMILYPLISKMGYGLTKKEAWILIYGGLRGALGLSLALIVSTDNEFPVRLQEIIVFNVAGMAALTLIINGTTCGKVVELLSVIKETPIKAKMQQNIMKDLVLQSNKIIQELKVERHLNLSDWDTVENLIGVQKLESLIEKQQSEMHQKIQIQRNSFNRSLLSENEETLWEIRYRVLQILRTLCWKKFKQAQLGEDAIKVLNEACSISCDDTHNKIEIWEYLYGQMTSVTTLNFMFSIESFPLIGYFAKYYINNHMTFVYEVITTFIICGKEIQSTQHEQIPLQSQYIQQIAQELKEDVKQAEKYISNLKDKFPEVIKTIQTKRAAYQILNKWKHHLKHLRAEGQIEPSEYINLKKTIDRKIISIDSHNFTWTVPTFQSFVLQFPMFKSLSNDQINKILDSSKEITLKKKQFFYKAGEKINFIFVVMKGTALDKFGAKKVHHGIGSILSYSNLISKTQLSFTTCQALQKTKVYCVPLKVLQQLMDENYEFEKTCYKNAMYYLVNIYPQKAKCLSQIDETKLIEYVQDADFHKITSHKEIQIHNGGYILQGELKRRSQILSTNYKQIYQKFDEIPPSTDKYQVTRKTILLMFQKPFGENEQIFKSITSSPKKSMCFSINRESIIDKQYNIYLQKKIGAQSLPSKQLCFGQKQKEIEMEEY